LKLLTTRRLGDSQETKEEGHVGTREQEQRGRENVGMRGQEWQ